MDAPYYNGEPGSRPYDREHDPREALPERALCCRCGSRALEYDGLLGYCPACWRQRSAAKVQPVAALEHAFKQVGRSEAYLDAANMARMSGLHRFADALTQKSVGALALASTNEVAESACEEPARAIGPALECSRARQR